MNFVAPDDDEKAAAVAALNADELQQLGITAKKAAEMTTNLTKQNVKVLDALKILVKMGGGSCVRIGDAKGKLLFEFAQVEPSSLLRLPQADPPRRSPGARRRRRGFALGAREAGLRRRYRREATSACSREPVRRFGLTLSLSQATEAVTLLKNNKSATMQDLHAACGVGESLPAMLTPFLRRALSRTVLAPPPTNGMLPPRVRVSFPP